jgi:hypothetical protein
MILTTDLTVTEELETSRTYTLSETVIQSFTDELDALHQAIYKMLNTEKYEYPIYSFSYGIELDSLIGKDQTYVKIELKRKIRDCLLQDERVTSVDNFIFTVNGDQMLCTFDVISIYGNTKISKEVNV